MRPPIRRPAEHDVALVRVPRWHRSRARTAGTSRPRRRSPGRSCRRACRRRPGGSRRCRRCSRRSRGSPSASASGGPGFTAGRTARRGERLVVADGAAAVAGWPRSGSGRSCPASSAAGVGGDGLAGVAVGRGLGGRQSRRRRWWGRTRRSRWRACRGWRRARRGGSGRRRGPPTGLVTASGGSMTTRTAVSVVNSIEPQRAVGAAVEARSDSPPRCETLREVGDRAVRAWSREMRPLDRSVNQIAPSVPVARPPRVEVALSRRRACP